MPDERSRQMLQNILYLSGVGFFAAGAFCFLSPGTLQELMGLDATTGSILGGALILVGISDFLIARFIFKGKDTL